MAGMTFKRKLTSFDQNKNVVLFDFRRTWEDVDLELANLATIDSAFAAAIAGAVAGANNPSPYRGFWSAGEVYFANDTVVFENGLWLAVFPTIAESPTEGDWKRILEIPTEGTLADTTYRGDWAAGTAFAQNDTVRWARALWQALAPTTGQDPTTTPAAWEKLLDFPNDTLSYKGAWAAGTAYAKNDTAVNAGALWQAVTPTTGTAPASPKWVKVVDLPPGGLRETVAVTTASLAAGAEATGTIALASGYRLLRVQTSAPARVRLYGSAAKGVADAAREIGTDPTGDHGLMLEYITTSTTLAATLSPTVDGYSMEATPSKNIPFAIENMSGAAAAITLTLTWQRTE